MKKAHLVDHRKHKVTAREKLRNFLYRLNNTLPVETDLKTYRPLLAEINALDLAAVRNTGLKDRAAQLREKVRKGYLLDDLIVEAYALVKETAMRQIGLRPHDAQILAGIVMHKKRIAELPTGEGKTLAAVFPAALRAFNGQGFHILTFNDYLARRDAAWMGPIFRFLGLSVGCNQEGLTKTKKKKAFGCDITYSTAKEAGFDFLRDQLCYSPDDLIHRPFNMALVDEADSIMIDEARIPLVIAGMADRVEIRDDCLAGLVREMKEDTHYKTDAEKRNIYLTDEGMDFAEATLGCSNLHDPDHLGILTALNCALHAEVLLQRDRDYIVRKSRVEIVDEFTGRVVDRRHWPDGLQRAVEAKENIKAKSEGSILGSITLQHYLRLYPGLCGMTATASSAFTEFMEFYGLPVSTIPPNTPCIRKDLPDEVFTTSQAKTEALVEEIKRVHSTGRPILVGTASVRESERLGAELDKEQISFTILNAKNDEKEASIIAGAGEKNAVTISTNMAGRGTDIRLGGIDEKGHDAVAALGGLYVLGTNRHESVRIDNQIRGRAGRQGDPGSSRFFISLEDPMIKRYGISKLFSLRSLKSSSDSRVSTPFVEREISRAQRILEGQNLDIRKNLWKYSNLLEIQRKILHQRRREILTASHSPDFLASYAPDILQDFLDGIGFANLAELECRVLLKETDRAWQSHLAFMQDLKESIHLVSVGGMTPLDEYRRQATEAFLKLEPDITQKALECLSRLHKDLDSIDLTSDALKGPSSTWTYMVNDEQLGWGFSMISTKNIGYSAGAAALMGPLYLLLALYHRFFRKTRK